MFQSAHTFCTIAIKVEVFPRSQVGHAWDIIQKYRVFVTHVKVHQCSSHAGLLFGHTRAFAWEMFHQEVRKGRQPDIVQSELYA